MTASTILAEQIEALRSMMGALQRAQALARLAEQRAARAEEQLRLLRAEYEQLRAARRP